MAVTSPGIVLGTPAYMSPEQVRGEPGGTRSDLWAFGCVFFELARRAMPIQAPTMAETIAAVLMTDPDWHALPTDAPNAVRELLRRCLDKDPQRRVQDVTEILVALDTRAARRSRDRTHGTEADDSFARRAAVRQHQWRSADGLSRRRSSPRVSSSACRVCRQLKVTAQSSVFRYKGQTDRALEIGRTLGVQAVLTGRVLQRGSALQHLGGDGRRRGLADLGRAVPADGGRHLRGRRETSRVRSRRTSGSRCRVSTRRILARRSYRERRGVSPVAQRALLLGQANRGGSREEHAVLPRSHRVRSRRTRSPMPDSPKGTFRRGITGYRRPDRGIPAGARAAASARSRSIPISPRRGRSWR